MLPDIPSSTTAYLSLIPEDSERISPGDTSHTYRWNPSHPNKGDNLWYSVVADMFHVLDRSDTLGGDEVC